MYQKLKNKGIHHVCLRCPDLYAARDFYRDAFGAEVVCEWGTDGADDHAFIMDLGTGDFLEIFESKEPFVTGKWQHVAIWSDDIYAAFEKAIACGATVHSLPAVSHIPTRSGQIVHMKYGFLNAPGGETVEIIQDANENDTK